MQIAINIEKIGWNRCKNLISTQCCTSLQDFTGAQSHLPCTSI